MIGASVAHAAVVDSGPVNIPIPDTLDGIYFNVLTGASSSSAAAVPGWDINPYSDGAGLFSLFGPTVNTWFNPQGVVTGNYNLPLGTVISGPTSAFFRPAGGTDVGTQVTLNSDNNYIGFRFIAEPANTNHFGFIQVQFGASATERAIVRYVFESTPDTALTVAAAVPPAISTYINGERE